MPHPGFRTITLPDIVYDALHDTYKSTSTDPSFASWFTEKMNQKIADQDKLKKMAAKIKLVPLTVTRYSTP